MDFYRSLVAIMQRRTGLLTNLVEFNVPSRHVCVIGHFGDELSRAINCPGIDNQTGSMRSTVGGKPVFGR